MSDVEQKVRCWTEGQMLDNASSLPCVPVVHSFVQQARSNYNLVCTGSSNTNTVVELAMYCNNVTILCTQYVQISFHTLLYFSLI